MIPAAANIARGLRYLGIDGMVTITKSDADRVWGWPNGPGLEAYCREHEWMTDPKFVAEHHHGAGSRSYREPDGCHPAMQIVFHPSPAGDFVEIDYDESAPVDVAGTIWHAKEVVENAVTKTTTDQTKIAQMLDKRFGVESNA